METEKFRAFCSECSIVCAKAEVSETERRLPECWLIHANKPKQRLCQVCFVMYQTIAELPYFIEAHREWAAEMKNRKRLKPGADYFG